MMSYRRIETPLASARRWAEPSAATEKPMMMALEAVASITSFSVILPVSE
jgi:hypothetical protein